MAYKPQPPKLIPQADGTLNIRGWLVFPVGVWHGEPFSLARVQGIVATYKRLKSVLGDAYTPKFRLGHDTKKRLMESMGLPNIGKIKDARMATDGTPFMEVDIDGVPRTTIIRQVDDDGAESFKVFDLEAAIRNGNYDGGSIELKKSMPDPSDSRKTLFDVFDGVALLGEEQPAAKLSAPLVGKKNEKPDGLMILAFSDYQEETPVMTDKQRIAMAMDVPESDASIQAMSDEQAKAFVSKMGSKTFADSCKKAFADYAEPQQQTDSPDVPMPAGAGAVPAAEVPPEKQMFSDLAQRLNVLEAQNESYRKQMAGLTNDGMTTFSDAEKRINECVRTGKITKVMREPFLNDARKLLSDKVLHFSDGEHKGKAKIAAFLEELEARPADLMFSEIVEDEDVSTDGDGILTPEEIRLLKLDRAGREILKDYKAPARTK